MGPSLRWGDGGELVIPVRARTSGQEVSAGLPEIPAFAGMTARRGRQNGLTITSTTMSTTAIPGTSFIILSPRPLSARSPRASFFP